MYLRNILLLVLFAAISADVQAIEALAGKPFPEKWRAIDSIIKKRPAEYSNNVSGLLDPYIEQAVSENDEELELLLKITQLKHKLFERSINDSGFVSNIRLLTIKARKKEWKHIEAIAHHVNSIYWGDSRNLAEAVKYAVKSYNLYHDYEPSYFVRKKEYIVELAQRYDAFDDVNNSLKYRYEAMQILPEFEYSSSIYNVLGLIHTDLGNYDSALYYYKKLYDVAGENDVKVWQVIATGNSIDVFTKQEMYDTALHMAMELLPLAEKYTGGDIVSNLLSMVASLHQKLGHKQKAEEYYEKALQRYRRGGEHWYYKNLYAARNIYKEYSEVKAAHGDYKLAYAYIDTLLLIKDSITKKHNISQLKSVEKELGKTKLDNANQLLSIEKKNAQIQRNLLISVIILATVIILFIRYWYNKRKETLEATKLSAENELQVSRGQLAEFTSNIQEKNKLLESLETKLTQYESNESTIDLADTISRLHETSILSDSDWVYFKTTFEKAHPGYLTRLQEKFPDLTQAEIRYIVLAKLNMSNNEMASVLGVATGSIRSTKSRMMKKLRFKSEEELRAVIHSV